jgi:hypothetical protein
VHNVYHVSEAKRTLLSLGQLHMSGYVTSGSGSGYDYLFADFLKTYLALSCPSSSDTACVIPWKRLFPVALLLVLHSLASCAC